MVPCVRAFLPRYLCTYAAGESSARLGRSRMKDENTTERHQEGAGRLPPAPVHGADFCSRSRNINVFGRPLRTTPEWALWLTLTNSDADRYCQPLLAPPAVTRHCAACCVCYVLTEGFSSRSGVSGEHTCRTYTHGLGAKYFVDLLLRPPAVRPGEIISGNRLYQCLCCRLLLAILRQRS